MTATNDYLRERRARFCVRGRCSDCGVRLTDSDGGRPRCKGCTASRAANQRDRYWRGRPDERDRHELAQLGRQLERAGGDMMLPAGVPTRSVIPSRPP